MPRIGEFKMSSKKIGGKEIYDEEPFYDLLHGLAYNTIQAATTGDYKTSRFQPGSSIRSSDTRLSFDSYVTNTSASVSAGATTIALNMGPVGIWQQMSTNANGTLSGGDSIAIHPNRTMIAGGGTSSPYIQVWDYTNGQIGSTIASQPSTTVGSYDIQFSPDGKWMISVGPSSSPIIWALNPATKTFGTKYVQTSISSTNTGTKVSWHPSGNFVAISFTGAPYFAIYPFNCSTGLLGTALSLPVDFTSLSDGNAFHPNGNYVAAVTSTSPYLNVFSFDEGTSTVTSIPIPSVNPPASSGNKCAFHPNGNFFAMTVNITPYVIIWPFKKSNGTWGAGFSPADTLGSPISQRDVGWSSNGDFFAVSYFNSTFLEVWKTDPVTSSIENKIASTTESPGGAVLNIAWDPSPSKSVVAIITTVSGTTPVRTYGMLGEHAIGEQYTIADINGWEHVTSQASTVSSVTLQSPLTRSYAAGAVFGRSISKLETEKFIPRIEFRGIEPNIDGNGLSQTSHNISPTNITSSVRGIHIHPNENWVAATTSSSPYINVFPFDASAGTLGTRVANPASLPPNSSFDVQWHPDGNYIAVAHASTPYFSIYPFDIATGTYGTKLASPATLPTGTGNSICWHPNGNFVVVGHASSPYISAYPFDKATGTIGAKIANPTGLPTTTVNVVKFTRVATPRLLVGINSTGSAALRGYGFDASTGAIGAFSTIPVGATSVAYVNDLGFSPDDSYVAMSGSTVTTAGKQLGIHPISSTGTISGALPMEPQRNVATYSACFSPDGTQALFLHNGYFSMYKFNNGTVGYRASNGTIPGIGYAVKWHPNGQWVFVGTSSAPYLSVYKPEDFTRTPVLVEHFRYRATVDLTSTNYILWVEQEGQGVLDIDVSISGTGEGAVENYNPMRKKLISSEPTNIWRFVGAITDPGNVMLLFKIQRNSTTDDPYITLLLSSETS